MIWLRRFGRQLRREGQEVIGGFIQIGAEEVLKAHGSDRSRRRKRRLPASPFEARRRD